MVTKELIISRLAQLGYVADLEDHVAIEFELNETLSYARNFCNREDLPDILDYRIVNRVCANFLFYKKNSGSLYGFDYDAVIKSIREGDTTVTFAVGQGEDTPENRFDAFVKSLERGFDKWLTPHRRLRW